MQLVSRLCSCDQCLLLLLLTEPVIVIFAKDYIFVQIFKFKRLTKNPLMHKFIQLSLHMLSLCIYLFIECFMIMAMHYHFFKCKTIIQYIRKRRRYFLIQHWILPLFGLLPNYEPCLSGCQQFTWHLHEFLFVFHFEFNWLRINSMRIKSNTCK